MLIYVDGRMLPKEQATISVFDHGFLYGDGVFEGIRVYDGNVFRLDEHVARLYMSARTIGLVIPMGVEEMTQAVLETVAANERRDAYIRLVVSRGSGDLGIDPAKCPRACVIVIVASISLYPEQVYTEGIQLVTSSVRRIPMECLDPRVKSLNYLNNIMAKLQAKASGCFEAIMLNAEGFVAECTGDNIFMVREGVLETPDLMQGALGGVTRGAVLDMARRAHIPVHEGRLALYDFYNAGESFLTGTAAELIPVVRIDGRPIADGRPGPITRQLLAAFRELRVQDGRKVTYASTPAVAG
jgi:branched-chain amino acid aminotransferase